MNWWKRVAARRQRKATRATWPNAPVSRPLRAKVHKIKFARSLSGLPKASKGWGQVGEARPAIVRRARDGQGCSIVSSRLTAEPVKSPGPACGNDA